MRFASHRDIARAVERGVRKAGLPIALSAGFTPHPKISYAGAAPTGTGSEAEYLELSLTESCAVTDVRDRLDAALPDGIDVIEVTERSAALDGLRLEASQWQAMLPGVSPEQAATAVEAFLAVSTAEVERLTNKGVRRLDARAAVITMEAVPRAATSGDDGNAILRMVVQHGVPAVRPDDILAALRRVADLAPASPPKVTRLAQGPLDEVAAGAAAQARVPGRRDHRREESLQAADRGGLREVNPGPERTAQEQEETTCPGPDAEIADPVRASAYDELPRGAESPERGSAPGSLTGDCPDARERAERQRVQQ